MTIAVPKETKGTDFVLNQAKADEVFAVFSVLSEDIVKAELWQVSMLFFECFYMGIKLKLDWKVN